jgi:hypothetical protein
LPRSPYIFAGRQGCRALMARSPSHRIPTTQKWKNPTSRCTTKGTPLGEIPWKSDQRQDCWAEGKHDHCNYLSAGWQVETAELIRMCLVFLGSLVKPALNTSSDAAKECFDLKSESITHTPRKIDLVVKDM